MAALAHVKGAIISRISVWAVRPRPPYVSCRRIATGRQVDLLALLAHDLSIGDVDLYLTFTHDLARHHLSCVNRLHGGSLFAVVCSIVQWCDRERAARLCGVT